MNEDKWKLVCEELLPLLTSIQKITKLIDIDMLSMYTTNNNSFNCFCIDEKVHYNFGMLDGYITPYITDTEDEE